MKKLFLVEEVGLTDVGLAFRDTVCDQLRRAEHEVIGPWCFPPLRGPGSYGAPVNEHWFGDWRTVNLALIEATQRQIDASDALVWLGDSAIGPTVAAAMGYAFARSKTIFVLRSEARVRKTSELPFDVQMDFMCNASGGLMTDSIAGLVEAVDLLAERTELQAAG